MKFILINPCTSFVQKRESLYNVAPFDQQVIFRLSTQPGCKV